MFSVPKRLRLEIFKLFREAVTIIFIDHEMSIKIDVNCGNVDL